MCTYLLAILVRGYFDLPRPTLPLNWEQDAHTVSEVDSPQVTIGNTTLTGMVC